MNWAGTSRSNRTAPTSGCDLNRLAPWLSHVASSRPGNEPGLARAGSSFHGLVGVVQRGGRLVSGIPAFAPVARRAALQRRGWADQNAKYIFLLPAVVYLLLLGIFPL